MPDKECRGWPLAAADCLPDDGLAGTLVGRVWRPGAVAGPAVVVMRPDGLYDISPAYPTISTLLETERPADAARGAALGLTSAQTVMQPAMFPAFG